MQLKQRLKNIEEKLSGKANDSNVCGCYRKHWESVVNSVYNDNPEIKIEVYPLPDFEKGFCDKCKTTFSREDIEGYKLAQELYGDLFSFVYCAKHLEMPENEPDLA